MTIANICATTLMEAIIVLALMDMSFRVIKVAVKVYARAFYAGHSMYYNYYS